MPSATSLLSATSPLFLPSAIVLPHLELSPQRIWRRRGGLGAPLLAMARVAARRSKGSAARALAVHGGTEVQGHRCSRSGGCRHDRHDAKGSSDSQFPLGSPMAARGDTCGRRAADLAGLGPTAVDLLRSGASSLFFGTKALDMLELKQMWWGRGASTAAEGSFEGRQWEGPA
jgi:hypothetical protein